MTLLAIAFGSFFITELLKLCAIEYITIEHRHWVKLVVVALLAAAITSAVGAGLAAFFGGIGLAALIHRVHRAFGDWGDVNRTQVVESIRRRSRI